MEWRLVTMLTCLCLSAGRRSRVCASFKAAQVRRCCVRHGRELCSRSGCARAGMAEAVDLYHIKTHYFTSHPKLNYYAIVPVRTTRLSICIPIIMRVACLLAGVHAAQVGPPEWWKTRA